MSHAIFANFSRRLSSPRLTPQQMVLSPFGKVRPLLEGRIPDQYCQPPGGLHVRHHR